MTNRTELDVRVKNCTWIRQVFPDWYDLDVSIKVAGKVFFGRGSDRNADTALSKAFCEAVERSVCHTHGISSLGVAGHITANDAKKNAKLEYIERRAIFHHFSKGLRPEEIPVNFEIQNRYREHGINLNLFRLESKEAAVIFCIANGLECPTPFGGILGLGADMDNESAAKKTIIECLRNLEAFIAAPSKSMSYENFKAIPRPDGRERQALLQDRDYFRTLMNSLNLDNRTSDQPVVGKYQSLEILEPNLSSCPLHFFRFAPIDGQPIQLDFVG